MNILKAIACFFRDGFYAIIYSVGSFIGFHMLMYRVLKNARKKVRGRGDTWTAAIFSALDEEERALDEEEERLNEERQVIYKRHADPRCIDLATGEEIDTSGLTDEEKEECLANANNLVELMKELMKRSQ